MATTKKLYNYDDPDDEDYVHPSEERIIIERREIIAEVVSSPNGTERMVVAAFHKAGEFLDEVASHDGDPVTVQFEYHGQKFFAGFGDL